VENDLKKKYDLTISVVLYKNDIYELKKMMTCVAETKLNCKLFLIDNSPTDYLRLFARGEFVEYCFNNKNIGFGRAQNMGINKIRDKSHYHLILNPDVSFKAGTLENIYRFMEQNHDVGQLMPRVCYNNGSVQKLCKLLPHPIDLIGRRFFGNAYLSKKRNKIYELNGFEYNRILDLPVLSGCFMFIRTSVLEQVGGFDGRYFMYLEDIDLTRRINKISRTIFYPGVTVEHKFTKGSYENLQLLKYHIVSAIKYFNKWGWIFDNERTFLNRNVLSQLKKNFSEYSQVI
jgi:GT2 family glycosyltransferase